MSHLPTSPGSRPLELLKVAELRDELRKKGLSHKGVKKELFERLEEAIKEEQEGIVHGEHRAAHKTSTSEGTEDFEEEEEVLDETKDKASKTRDMMNACPSDQLLSSCPSNNLLSSCPSDLLPSSCPNDALPVTPPSTTDEATPISETCESSGVSAPAGVPGFNEDKEQHSPADVASVGTINDVLFVDNAVCEDGDAMLLPEKVPSVGDALEPGKEASRNHETRPEIATSSENVDGAPESAFAHSVNENVVSDVINASIENGDAHVAVDNAVSSNDASRTDCATQHDEKANLLAGPEVVADQLSKSETLIEVSPSETDHKALKQPTLDSGLPVDKAHEETEVGDLKTENLSVASQNFSEAWADSKYEELEKPNVDEREMIVYEEKPDVKMEADTGLEEKHKVVIAVGMEKPDLKMEPIQVDAVLEHKHKLINKEMQIDKEDPFQLKSSSKESQLKEVKVEKSSHDYSAESGDEQSSRVPDECKSNATDNDDLKCAEDGSQACIDLKRKDTDLKQQEPGKRMRRWNSGKEVAVDALKPLTTDTVKEIILPESTGGSFAAAQRLAPKAAAASRELPPDSGNTPTVPPSTRAPSNSLKIERFVRPFTLKAVKDLLGEFGQCVDFWMDQIKTHCFVTYSSVNEAVAARSGLYGRQWPPSVGNFLVAEFVDSNEVKIRSEGLAEKAQVAPLWNANVPPTPPPRVVQSAPLFRSSSNSLQPSRFSRETRLPPTPKKVPEPAVLTLEDLFFKTKAKPSIYYLPLTDEQVAEKLAAAKNKRATR